MPKEVRIGFLLRLVKFYNSAYAKYKVEDTDEEE
ncbi:hypothetical protein D917_01547 [Trichinella nativa]|uniref:Uncharacterized protein n=1 Tax=Trichinella nativa TaxID=6335 RepID=A0A1Y3ENS9_9BILA|nr:hypothetical protein D917_01547 [Trichinella nativa]